MRRQEEEELREKGPLLARTTAKLFKPVASTSVSARRPAR